MAEPARQTVTAAATVTVGSERFGDIVVGLDRVITFDRGLVGVTGARRFALSEPSRSGSPFRHLISLDRPELGFVVCDPGEFWPDYHQHVPRPGAVQGALAVLAIVTIPSNPREMTANLLAPLVVDVDHMRGWQLILDGGDYHTQHRLLPDSQPKP